MNSLSFLVTLLSVIVERRDRLSDIVLILKSGKSDDFQSQLRRLFRGEWDSFIEQLASI